MTTKNPAGAVGEYLDERVGIAKGGKGLLRKVFPDHWSFMLGEIALYSFIVLLLTGTFLTLFFKPSMGDVIYHGSYVPLQGVRMSEAYASTLDISFDIRGGLVIRQIHHWAALTFIAAITIHMLRIFFTGAFRKPRELNWLIGILLLTLAIVEGFAGYSLPDDLLSGGGLRIADGIIRSIPIVGTYLEFFLFGGQFPGHALVPRLYMVHILLVPAIILGLISVHLFLVFYQKHTQYPGPGRTEQNVVGYPMLPVYAAKAGGFFFIVFGLSALMGGIAQINPIWSYGPYAPDQVTAGSQPDWYMGFLEGALRMMPNWEFDFLGHTVSLNVLFPAVILPGIIATAAALYPFLESWVTGDKREHHLLDRPRNQATRTAIGVAFCTFYLVLWLGGGNDLLATHLHLSINAITWTFRILVWVLPVVAFVATKRIALGLQRRDKEKVLHGREAGIIKRLPHGEFIEAHEPLDQAQRYVLTSHEVRRPIELPAETDENGIPRPGTRVARLRARLSRWYFRDHVAKPTVEEYQQLTSGHGPH